MLFSKLGLLRVSLLAIALFNLLISAFEWIGNDDFSVQLGDDPGLWQVAAIYIAPVNAPIILVVVFFDYLMSRVRASDATGEERDRFILISRIELAMIVLYFAYWGPYFASLLNL